MSACAGEEAAVERVDLTIEYQFEGAGCAEAGAFEITVVARGSAFGEGRSDVVTCSQEPEQITFGGLRVDFYEITIQARDERGLLLYETEEPVPVRVAEDTTAEIDVPVATGDLTLTWSFEGIQACGPVLVVDVTLIDPFDALFDDALYDCFSGGVFYNDVPAGEWIVRLQGIGVAGTVLFRSGSVRFTVTPGANNAIPIELGSIP